MVSDRGTCRPPWQQRAFLDLVKRVEAELIAYVGRCVGHGGGANDIVQRTLLRAWGDAKFDPTHLEARAWLFKTAKRLVIDWLRSEESNSISLDDLTAMPADRKARDPLVDLIDRETERYLDIALREPARRSARGPRCATISDRRGHSTRLPRRWACRSRRSTAD